jgi:hypothetical protein
MKDVDVPAEKAAVVLDLIMVEDTTKRFSERAGTFPLSLLMTWKKGQPSTRKLRKTYSSAAHASVVVAPTFMMGARFAVFMPYPSRSSGWNLILGGVTG